MTPPTARETRDTRGTLSSLRTYPGPERRLWRSYTSMAGGGQGEAKRPGTKKGALEVTVHERRVVAPEVFIELQRVRVRERVGVRDEVAIHVVERDLARQLGVVVLDGHVEVPVTADGAAPLALRTIPIIY